MQKHGITLLTQPTDKTCVQTCLAMALNKPVEEVIEKYGSNPLNQLKLMYALTEEKIYWNQLTQGTLIHTGWYFAAVPSLNKVGTLHQVLFYYSWDTGEFLVFDPSPKKKYDMNGKDVNSWADLIAIRIPTE